MSAALLALLLAAACTCSSGEDTLTGAIVISEFVADSMPTPQCHASTVAEVDGKLVVAWFGGTYEGNDDVGIWFSRKDSSGWSIPERVTDGRGLGGVVHPCWNPVLHKQRHGPLMLFYKAGPNPREWWGMLITSTDCGATWSSAQRLPDGVIGPVKNKPLELESGDLLCPSSTEDKGWRVWFERTTDCGVTWTRLGPMNDPAEIEAIQPTILSRSDGVLQAVGRTKQGRMFSMGSTDDGHTWSGMELMDFWCSNSGLDGVVLRDGRMLIVYNHGRNIPGEWVAGREMLNVAVSTNGREWKAGCVLERERGEEFSYPAVIQTADGFLHITYTWKRQRIRHVVLDPARLQGRPFRGLEWE